MDFKTIVVEKNGVLGVQFLSKVLSVKNSLELSQKLK
jgi:hypothetical protein